ncbi:MAG: hypothetical protein JXQ29_02405, partial [Planctomycetes bacterium]|nr:hypothetical protein [Planctomycetota bacterium]
LAKEGESSALIDRDGKTLLDWISGSGRGGRTCPWDGSTETRTGGSRSRPEPAVRRGLAARESRRAGGAMPNPGRRQRSWPQQPAGRPDEGIAGRRALAGDGQAE